MPVAGGRRRSLSASLRVESTQQPRPASRSRVTPAALPAARDPLAVKALRGLLADHDLSALDQFAGMRAALGVTLGAECFDALQAAVDDLEFDRALGCWRAADAASAGPASRSASIQDRARGGDLRQSRAWRLR
jgi:hypothetical protein